MATSQADTAILEQTARKFEEGNQNLQGMLTRLMGELEVLQSAWQGAGGSSFQEVKRRYNDDQTRIQQALQETAEAIRTSGQTYTSTDSDAASRVNATHRGQALPL